MRTGEHGGRVDFATARVTGPGLREGRHMRPGTVKWRAWPAWHATAWHDRTHTAQESHKVRPESPCHPVSTRCGIRTAAGLIREWEPVLVADHVARLVTRPSVYQRDQDEIVTQRVAWPETRPRGGHREALRGIQFGLHAIRERLELQE